MAPGLAAPGLAAPGLVEAAVAEVAAALEDAVVLVEPAALLEESGTRGLAAAVEPPAVETSGWANDPIFHNHRFPNCRLLWTFLALIIPSLNLEFLKNP